MKKNPGVGLGVILVLSLLLSVVFAAKVPFNGNPDELSHRDYIRLLIANKGPIKFEPPAGGMKATSAAPSPDDPPTNAEVHQPPLYYLLCIPVQAASGGSIFAVRMVAAVLQLLTIYLCWWAMRDLFPGREELALGVAAFVAFLPSQAQLSASISNDSLTTLLCAALFWRFGAVALRGQNRFDALRTGVLLGAGLLTKSSVLQIVPGLLVAYWLAVKGQRMSAKDAAACFLTTLFLGLLIASPWLVRNQMLYGDPLALSIYKLTGPNFSPEQMMQVLGWSTADYARNVGVLSFVTFWYILPPDRLKPPPILMLVTILLALGGMLGAYRWATRGSEEEAGERRVIGTFALGAALLVPIFAKFVFTVFQAQGRYFLPALLPIAAVTVLGWTALTGAKGRIVGPVLVAVVLLGLTALQISQH